MTDAVIHTLGHSNHDLGDLLALLGHHGIEVVVDVRAVPHSGRFPQYRKRALERSLPEHDIGYRWMGDTLGGVGKRSDAATFAEIARRRDFHDALDAVVDLAAAHRPALMCAERDPVQCHRTALIARQLRTRPGVALRHILADGSVEPQASLDARLVAELLGDQGELFAPRDDAVERAYAELAARMTGERPAG
ncbi:Protein of unknown function, DUF488 [Limimonas halophila]|uniref:DUF488 domain-containing protein n=1 Tax=Limimonas halophila TaxID=1082479 RepID=A0A1G7LM96_9PROT|nr:DUF488 domain-containing protein [Limimonas halophila]SDF50615.1 Protein of unknown function, DUF488 [Limimonas halophila]